MKNITSEAELCHAANSLVTDLGKAPGSRAISVSWLMNPLECVDI